MLVLTFRIAENIKIIHDIKKREGYIYDENDVKYKSTNDVLKLAFYCMIAAILCGCTGIAGGMVLGPLFLSYNMLPLVMGATN